MLGIDEQLAVKLGRRHAHLVEVGAIAEVDARGHDVDTQALDDFFILDEKNVLEGGRECAGIYDLAVEGKSCLLELGLAGIPAY